MKIFATTLTAFLLIGSFTGKVSEHKKPQLFVSNHENILGTSLEFKISSNSEAEVAKAEQAALNEIKRLSNIFSAYNTNSEFSKWMKQDLNKPVKVSKELFEMLHLFELWKEKTNGALDASAAVATQLWKNSASENKLPSKLALKKAAATMQGSHFLLDSTSQTATRLDQVPLVMNSFAKSYIINKAATLATNAAQVNNVVVNIGGDLVVKGNEQDLIYITNPFENAENDAPLAKLLVANKAVATSGNYRRGVKIGKNWYSHIIDPRTAKPVNGIVSATVIAANAVDAGALATAFNVLTLTESKTLAESIGADYLIVTKNGKIVTSKGWSKYVLTENKPIEKLESTLRSPFQKAWDPKFELAINFQFNAIENNTHRPFAAIWIENEKREPVRNLALWYNKPKWVPDLRNWYRINGERFKAEKESYASVTGATRNPGKYTVKWDGKDETGKYVPQGKYTVIIETSKEHGTDEILRQQLQLTKSPLKITHNGNVEISNVSFEFAKKR